MASRTGADTRAGSGGGPLTPIHHPPPIGYNQSRIGAAPEPSTRGAPERLPMADVEKSRTIRAPIAAVWAALTDVDGIEGWMGVGQVQELDLTIGGRFAFFGGSPPGAFTVIDRPHRLAYTWRQAEWPAGGADSRGQWGL